MKDGHYTSFINGQKLYETDLPEQHDPWLAVLGIAGNSSRAARNFVITGQPQIPEELDLLAPANLNGWLTDYYGNDWSVDDRLETGRRHLDVRSKRSGQRWHRAG